MLETQEKIDPNKFVGKEIREIVVGKAMFTILCADNEVLSVAACDGSIRVLAIDDGVVKPVQTNTSNP